MPLRHSGSTSFLVIVFAALAAFAVVRQCNPPGQCACAPGCHKR